MLEVIVSGTQKQFTSQVDADKFIADVQTLLGAEIIIQVNEVENLVDTKATIAGFKITRIKEYPVKVEPIIEEIEEPIVEEPILEEPIVEEPQ